MSDIDRGFVHESADVSPLAFIGRNSKIWHLAQIRESAKIGDECIIGRGVYVGPGVTIGDRTKVQNFAQIYDPAYISSGVFIGPGVIVTNDIYPRSVDIAGDLKHAGAWQASGVTIRTGASIGARSVVLAGVTVGAWALVGAGSVVIRDIPPHALIVGNPGRQVGWVGRAGQRLDRSTDGNWSCPVTGETYRLVDDELVLE